jgi:ribosomal protein S28E/S33
MSGTQSYEYFPAIRCWVKHLLEGKYNAEEKSLFTIFGALRKIRFVATITNREDFVSNTSTGDLSTNLRFELDDGTGLISAVKWGVDLDKFNELNRGDVVDILGRVGFYGDTVQISNIKLIKKVKDPNYILLRDAEIIKKIKSGDIHEIPIDFETEEEFSFDNASEEIRIDKIFGEEQPSEVDKLKEKIFSIIYEYSQDGNGISLKELQLKLQIPENKLRTYINDLAMESRIYLTEENIYQSYI